MRHPKFGFTNQKGKHQHFLFGLCFDPFCHNTVQFTQFTPGDSFRGGRQSDGCRGLRCAQGKDLLTGHLTQVEGAEWSIGVFQDNRTLG